MPNRAVSGRSQKPVQKKKPQHQHLGAALHWTTLIIPGAVALVLMIASFGFAASMEEHDSFCASCHTQPETTYFNRTQQKSTVDLATFHFTKEVKCIDCHSGNGVGGRVGAMLLGARNAGAYFTHTAVQPAPLTVAIADANCIKCHQETMTRSDFNNHFHAFLTRWQAADPSAATCLDCHSAHNTSGDAQIAYLSQTPTEQQCQRCHNALGAGG